MSEPVSVCVPCSSRFTGYFHIFRAKIGVELPSKRLTPRCYSAKFPTPINRVSIARNRDLFRCKLQIRRHRSGSRPTRKPGCWGMPAGVVSASGASEVWLAQTRRIPYRMSDPVARGVRWSASSLRLQIPVRCRICHAERHVTNRDKVSLKRDGCGILAAYSGMESMSSGTEAGYRRAIAGRNPRLAERVRNSCTPIWDRANLWRDKRTPFRNRPGTATRQGQIRPYSENPTASQLFSRAVNSLGTIRI